MTDSWELPAAADFHVHLRDGDMMKLVVPTIRQGGVNTVYVMPNLLPPITSVQQAIDYRSQLQAIEPNVTFLMSLYLHPDITPATIKEAKAAGITGVKSYPAGVTTNSSAGVVDYTLFWPVFAEMERQNMLLNLHGECPSGEHVTFMNAEETFLPTLKDLHKRFPKLRIVLEHCTTAAAVEAVKDCGSTVVGTITAHHLYLTVDDVFTDPFCFCKPVAKLPEDRTALLKAAASGNPKFFLGTDSAPHPAQAKRGGDKIAAGVFTQPYAVALVLDAFELGCKKGALAPSQITQEMLEGFLGTFGRRFYSAPDERAEKIRLTRNADQISAVLKSDATGVEVVPFKHGDQTWKVTWM